MAYYTQIQILLIAFILNLGYVFERIKILWSSLIFL